jgi:hypothetical protein
VIREIYPAECSRASGKRKSNRFWFVIWSIAKSVVRLLNYDLLIPELSRTWELTGPKSFQLFMATQTDEGVPALLAKTSVTD